MHPSVEKFTTTFSVTIVQFLIFTKLKICEKNPLRIKFFILWLQAWRQNSSHMTPWIYITKITDCSRLKSLKKTDCALKRWKITDDFVKIKDRKMDWKENSDNKETPWIEQMFYKEFILIDCYNKKILGYGTVGKKKLILRVCKWKGSLKWKQTKQLIQKMGEQ